MSLSIRQWLVEHNIPLAGSPFPAAQMAGVAFRLVQEMQVKSLSAFDICPLAEILELPWPIARQGMPAIAAIAVEMLRILSRKKPLRRNEGTWLAFQIAYIQALAEVLEQEYIHKRPWLDRGNVFSPTSVDPSKHVLSDPQLQALLKTLRPGRLSDTQAEQALTLIGESFLVQQINNLAVAWFVANGAEDIEAKLIVSRLIYGFPGYLLDAIASNAVPLAQLQKFVRLGNGSPVLAAIASDKLEMEAATALTELVADPSNFIDLHRERYRAGLQKTLSAPVFEELFALQDIYVPLKGVEVNSQQESPNGTPAPLDLMEWATNQLTDLETVALIEAPPGAGKTSFCQIWAAKVAFGLYPSWMPILIRLRDVTLGRTLEQSLDSAFGLGKLTRTDGWLLPPHPPCLLILDGLDELPPSPQTTRHLYRFLEQVQQFITTTSARYHLRHKILITCRADILSGTQSNLPLQPHSLPAIFRRFIISSLDQEQLKLWFKQWSKLQSNFIAKSYFNFLKQGGVFHYRADVRDFATLAHRPLMLLLLGLLYRDGRIDDSILPLMGAAIRFEIHDRLYRWLLGDGGDALTTGENMPLQGREGNAHAGRTSEAIANLKGDRSSSDFTRQMQAVALAILQSPDRSCNLEQIGTLQERQSSPVSFPRLYFHPLADRGRVIFSHPSLGDYLTARAIAHQLKVLTAKVQDSYGEVKFVVDSPADLAQHLYKLLAFGILSPEVEELAIAALKRQEARDRHVFSFAVLFERLYQFYRSFCRGRWLDTGVVHEARHLVPSHAFNALQIDAAVGLNVFLLLCAAHREAVVPFYPCGDPQILHEFDPDRLLTLIGRTTVLSPIAFWQRARLSLHQLSLEGACLHHALLAQGSFWKTNFFKADLVGTNFSGANLQEANLSWANLTGANLSGANLSAAKLEGANLTGANLTGATLQLVSLTNACLYQAQMDEATREFAQTNGAIFSLEQYYACQQALAGLEMANNQQEEENLDVDTLLLIERASGAIVTPDTSEADYMNEETVFLE
jgi:uncharacterized protein YjbI with pentapeptide repeats